MLDADAKRIERKKNNEIHFIVNRNSKVKYYWTKWIERLSKINAMNELFVKKAYFDFLGETLQYKSLSMFSIHRFCNAYFYVEDWEGKTVFIRKKQSMKYSFKIIYRCSHLLFFSLKSAWKVKCIVPNA